MYSRHRCKEENEETLRRQANLENLNKKKEWIKNEFDKLQEEEKFDDLTIKSDNDIPFKRILNEMRNLIGKKQQTLFRAQNQNQISCPELALKPKEKLSNFNINTSFIKSSYKTKVFELSSYKIEKNQPYNLKKKLNELKEEIEEIKNKIENENINKSSLQSKLIEVENSKKIKIFQMNDLNFVKKVTFRRFTDINALLFNAKTKSKLSLLHLSQMKNEMNEIQTIENDFFKQKFSNVKEEKHNIEKEQTELLKILLQIDVN